MSSRAEGKKTSKTARFEVTAEIFEFKKAGKLGWERRHPACNEREARQYSVLTSRPPRYALTADKMPAPSLS